MLTKEQALTLKFQVRMACEAAEFLTIEKRRELLTLINKPYYLGDLVKMDVIETLDDTLKELLNQY